MAAPKIGGPMRPHSSRSAKAGTAVTANLLRFCISFWHDLITGLFDTAYRTAYTGKWILKTFLFGCWYRGALWLTVKAAPCKSFLTYLFIYLLSICDQFLACLRTHTRCCIDWLIDLIDLIVCTCWSESVWVTDPEPRRHNTTRLVVKSLDKDQPL